MSGIFSVRLCFLVFLLNVILVQCSFTEGEIFLLRRQVADRELGQAEQKHVEDSIEANVLLLKEVRELSKGTENNERVEKLNADLERNFLTLMEFVTSKPISTHKLDINRAMTQAAMASSAKLRADEERDQSLFVAAANEKLELQYLEETFSGMISRASSYGALLTDKEHGELLGAIHHFHELELDRLERQLGSSDPGAKRAYDMKARVDWLFSHFDESTSRRTATEDEL